MSLNSQNNKNYATFDVDNFSEAGLQKFMAMLAKAGAPVASVTASNRAIVKGLTSSKKADFYFNNGQRAMIRIGAAGDIVILEINGKAVPLKSPDTLQKVAEEIADYLKRGQPAFDKSLFKKLKSVRVETALRPASVPLSKKIAEAKTGLAESIAQEQLALAEIERQKQAAADAENQLKQRKTEYSLSAARTRQLKDELKLLGA
jgi:hypothetical protein